MNSKIRVSLLVASLIGTGTLARAQSVEQGKKFYYYTRYQSAKDNLEKVLASNPNNIDAMYWLGETLLQLKDSAGAEALYSKALQTNGSAPLLLVGMGHIELRKGKTADARTHFETAISLSKGKDINVLNAVGSANADIRVGDATYAIEKLNQATQVKNFNNADTYIIMGDAYRKLVEGGDAVQSYQKALGIDPKLAAAKFKEGMIYLTQNNKDYFLPDFEAAVQLDPNYAPAYYQLFYYYALRDVNKAGEYLDKYIANMDPGPEVEYTKTDQLYNQAKFAEAKTKALGLISSLGDKVEPRMYKMVAYTCDTLGDLACAKQNIDVYFQKQDTAKIIGGDYAERANISAKSPDTTTKLLAFTDYKLAIARDTIPEFRNKYIASANDLAKKLGNKKAAAEVAAIVYSTKKNPVNSDLYAFGIANYQAGNYKTADSIFCGIYEVKYPTEIFGYLWCARSLAAQDDSTNSKGLAVDAYEKLAVVGRGLDSTAKANNTKDSVLYRPQILQAYFFLAQYYNDIKKDKAGAIRVLEGVIEVDPTNATAAKFLEILKRPARQPAARPKAAAGAPPAKPSSGR